MALFTPTTSPRRFTSGPPELPGLIGASVWMKSSIAQRLPPMASTHSPMRAPSELPSRTVGSPRASTLITAMSVSGSAPTMRACMWRLSCSTTSILVAPCTTWLLVMM
jgi:hypothetical protein